MKCYQPFGVPGNTITVGFKAGSKYMVRGCVVISHAVVTENKCSDTDLHYTGRRTNKQIKTYKQANKQTNKESSCTWNDSVSSQGEV